MKKFSRQFGSILGSIDLYSQPINLLFKRNELYSTKTGQLLSIIAFAFTSIAFLSMTLDMVGQTSPNVVGKVQSNMNPQQYFLSPDNFFFLVGIADESGLPLTNTPEKRYFDFYLQFCHQETSFNQTSGKSQTDLKCIHIDMIPCSQAQVPENLTQGLPRERMNQGVCINSTTWNKHRNGTYINGLASALSFGYVSFSIYPCDNSLNTNCVSQTEIQERMKYGYLSVTFTDKLLDQTKPGDPYQTVSKVIVAKYQQNSCTSLTYTLRHSYTYSETNYFYFLPTVDQYHVLTLVGSSEATLSITSPLVHLNFFLDDKSEIYYRTYATFFDILGNVGGIQAFLMFALSLLAKPITRTAQHVDILNSIFTFDDDSKLSNSFSNNIFTSSRFNRNKSITLNQSPMSKSQQTTQRFDDLKNFINQKNKRLDLKCYEYCCGGQKTKLLKIGQKKIEKQLDVSVIITKLFELEKLKHYLLDENQLKLFDYIPKPLISLKSQIFDIDSPKISPMKRGKTVEYFSEDLQFDLKVQKALESYRQLRQSSKAEDQKLIEMMDGDIRDLFNDIIVEVNQKDYMNMRTFSRKEMEDLDRPDERIIKL